MANTYSQIYVQIVFAVKGRQCLIPSANREELHKYIAGIIEHREQKLIAVFAMPDHVHILIGIKPAVAISDLVRDIKAGTSKFITERGWTRGKFSWQEGFGCFSYSRSHISALCDYILRQEEHHKQHTFKEEYLDFLKKFEVEYDEKYLFEWLH